MGLVLKQNSRGRLAPGPLLLAVLDGIGVGARDDYDAVHLARTPTMDRLDRTALRRNLVAHGRAVGLPSDDDMGNSEVCHNLLGAGRVFDQGAKLVNRAIASGAIFASPTWKEIERRCAGDGGALHLIGLLSDGNVHSHEKHLHAILRQARKADVRRVFVHALLDGRDVPARSALQYVDRLEDVLGQAGSEPGYTYRIASGGGRMLTTMDRYEADWSIVERGWQAHVQGEGRRFGSAREAIESLRAEDSSVDDQFLPAFVIANEDRPVGRIVDGDAVVLFNFRGDRAIEISRAFEEDEGFDRFDRVRTPDVLFAGMMLYDGDLGIPRRFLVEPPAIDRTISEYLAGSGVRQYALSETQKFGHVTYFWNGNRSGKFDDALERYEEVKSDNIPFEQRPWMKAGEITDRAIACLRSGDVPFGRLNYPNGDMVGHSGDIEATILAVEAVDLSLGRLVTAIDRCGGTLVVVADHGNADDMCQRDKRGRPLFDSDGRVAIRTSHSLNPVPFWVYSGGDLSCSLRDDCPDAGLGHVAATLLDLMGYLPPDDYLHSLVR